MICSSENLLRLIACLLFGHRLTSKRGQFRGARQGMSDFRETFYLLNRLELGGPLMNIRISTEHRVIETGEARLAKHIYRVHKADGLHAFLRDLLSQGHTWFYEDGAQPDIGFDRDPITVPALPFVKMWERPLRQYAW